MPMAFSFEHAAYLSLFYKIYLLNHFTLPIYSLFQLSYLFSLCKLDTSVPPFHNRRLLVLTYTIVNVTNF